MYICVYIYVYRKVGEAGVEGEFPFGGRSWLLDARDDLRNPRPKYFELVSGFFSGRFSAHRGPRQAPGAPGADPVRKMMQITYKIIRGDQL